MPPRYLGSYRVESGCARGQAHSGLQTNSSQKKTKETKRGTEYAMHRSSLGSNEILEGRCRLVTSAATGLRAAAPEDRRTPGCRPTVHRRKQRKPRGAQNMPCIARAWAPMKY